MIGSKQAQNMREVLNEFHMLINPVKQTCISDASANTRFMQILTGCLPRKPLYNSYCMAFLSQPTSIVPAVIVGLNLLRAVPVDTAPG